MDAQAVGITGSSNSCAPTKMKQDITTPHSVYLEAGSPIGILSHPAVAVQGSLARGLGLDWIMSLCAGRSAQLDGIN